MDRPACWVPSCLCSLLLSSTAAETPETELLRSSVSHAQQLTFAPRTPAPHRKQLSHTPALALVGYGGMYAGRGQMSSTAPMTVRPRATPHLICRCVTVRSLYVRITAVQLLHYTGLTSSFPGQPAWVSRYQKGKTSLDLNDARDVMGFWEALASAGPCRHSAPCPIQITRN